MQRRRFTNKWVEHNKKEYGYQISELKKIIENQVLATGSSDEFTSNMLVALVSGRKITEKMEQAIDKIIMVREMISDTDWSKGYRGNSYNFLNSIIEQAKSRKSLSKKQMEAVNKLYHRVKKNVEKNKKSA